MVHQTSTWLLHTNMNQDFVWFVFFSTLCSYNFHWYLTSHSVVPSPRIQWAFRYRGLHTLFFFIGLTGSSLFFFRLQEYWLWLSLAILATFLYSAPKVNHPWFRQLRKVALGKTIFLSAVWTGVTTVIPIIMNGGDWQMHYTLFILHRFFLVYAICILFDYRDREDDKAAGIRSLITFMSKKGIFILFITSLIISIVAAFLMTYYGYSLSNAIMLSLPVVITCSLYGLATSKFHDMLYYFILDGLMALSALLMLLPRI